MRSRQRVSTTRIHRILPRTVARALCLTGLALLPLPRPARAWNPAAADNYYGFVVYTWDENAFGWDHEIFPLARSLGAGWIQAEGPQVLSASVHWGRIVPDSTADLMDPASYDFSMLDWIGAADAEGLNVVLTLSTGNEHVGWSTWSPWVRCTWVPWNILNIGCNCLPRDWDDWYAFVYQVARHFDGMNGPDVRIFQTIGEPGNTEGFYFQGTAVQMYGGGPDSVTIHRYDGTTSRLPAAIVPVAHLAVHDARTDARLSLGAPYGGVEGTVLTAVHERYDQYSPGGFTPEEAQAVLDLAHEFDLHLISDSTGVHEITFADLETWLFAPDDNPAYRGREFIEAALAQPSAYDLFGAHLYNSDYVRYGWLGPGGGIRSMAYLRERFAAVRPVWVNGIGMWGNLYADRAEVHPASFLIRSMTGAYAARMGSITWTGISDGILLPPPVSLYENIFNPVPGRARYAAAGTFSLLARVFPDTLSFALEAEIVPAPPDTDVVLYQFRIDRADLGAQGYAAVGWAIDEVPDPYNALSFDNPDCPKAIDVAPLLGIAPGTNLAVYDYRGDLVGGGPTQDPVMTFDEAPFLLTWGDDSDGDGIPDISDNCPDRPNPRQGDFGDVVRVDGIALEAPDGRGFACDHVHGREPVAIP